MRRLAIILIVIASLQNACKSPSGSNSFVSNWNTPVARVWAGPEYWTNPMQDWQAENGRLTCNFAGPGRTVHLLTYDLEKGTGNFETSVIAGLPFDDPGTQGWAGFIIGARGEFNDYRDAAVYGKGITAGVTAGGKLFIGNPPGQAGADGQKAVSDLLHSENGLILRFVAEYSDNEEYTVILSAIEKGSMNLIEEISSSVKESDLQGNIALQSHFNNGQAGMKDRPGFWFEGWKASGEKLINHPDRAFGPVLFTLYSLSKNVMKLTAQMPPVSANDAGTVALEIRTGDNGWEQIAEADIDQMARTATFRVEEWDMTRDQPYRTIYKWSPDGRKPQKWY